ncbi:MAG: HD domain-containing phosphohydrolase [Bacillota bacterium]|nr:HD domain-containing phosphohydrolase [Bacillota bacterium]
MNGRPDLGPEPAIVAHEHHERLDGSGYPQGLHGGDIHPFARIAAVADVFDAMSTDRVYRWRYLPHVTLETLVGGMGTLFDPAVVKAFCEAVAVYPNGTVVRLTNGPVGRPQPRFRADPLHRGGPGNPAGLVPRPSTLPAATSSPSTQAPSSRRVS